MHIAEVPTESIYFNQNKCLALANKRDQLNTYLLVKVYKIFNLNKQNLILFSKMPVFLE